MKQIRILFFAVAAILIALTYNNCSQTSDSSSSSGGSSSSGNTNTSTPSYQCGGASFTSDTFTLNASVNGQHGWYSDPSSNFDEKVVDIGTDACRGTGVWKISNAVTSSGFGNQPISPAFTNANGESTVKSSGGGDSMSVSFFIRTVAAVADGSSVTTSLSPTSADRHNYLRIINDLDANGGFRILAIDGILLDQTHVVAQNISRGVWHHVKIVNNNPDGGSNDVVQVYLDGNLVSTHTTWEDWRTAIPATTLAVTRFLFRLNVTAASVDASFTGTPAGFYIDDLEQKSFNASTPSLIIESYSTGFEH